MAKTGFFEATRAATERIERFYDWYSPAMIGIWNLRKLVENELSKNKDLNEKQIEDILAQGSGVHWSAFKKMARRDFEEIKSEMGWSLVMEVCSAFEGWLESIFRDNYKTVFPAATSRQSKDLMKENVKNLQVPGKCFEVLDYLKRSAPTKSAQCLVDVFAPTLKRSRDYAIEKLECLMKGYRLIKEIRNSRVHNGGKATKDCVGAYECYAKLEASDLKLPRKPRLNPIQREDDVLSLSSYDVNAFAHIVLTIIKTLDVEFIGTRLGVEEFKKRWSSHQGGMIKTFSSNPKKAKLQLLSWLKRFYNFNINEIDQLRRFLNDEDLCRF